MPRRNVILTIAVALFMAMGLVLPAAAAGDPVPQRSTYTFAYELPHMIDADEDVEVEVTFETDVEGDVGYDGVRFAIEADGPGTVTFTATDSEGVEHTFLDEGFWGPSGGFDLPAAYEATTDWTLNFSKEGEYTITFSLIESLDGEVVSDITDSVTVYVGPVASTYKFDYEVPDEIDADEDVQVSVTFETDQLGHFGYDAVRFAILADGPGTVSFTAVDSEDEEHTFSDNGFWGPAAGFDLPAAYEATTDWTLNFSEDGKYTITFSLIEAPDGDVVSGITDSATVHVGPVASTYVFDYELPAEIVMGEDVEVPITFKTDVEGDFGYEGVRFAIEAEGPGTVLFTAVDSEDEEHTFSDEGFWGPSEGFALPADYDATTDWTLNFSEAGEYTITFALIDAVTEEVVADIQGSASVTVTAEASVSPGSRVEWRPPVTNMEDVVVQYGTTLPLKFRMVGEDGYVARDVLEGIYLEIDGVVTWKLGVGGSALRFGGGQYIANFHTRNYDLEENTTYEITVRDADGSELGSLSFEVSMGKGVSRGRGPKK